MSEAEQEIADVEAENDVKLRRLAKLAADQKAYEKNMWKLIKQSFNLG